MLLTVQSYDVFFITPFFYVTIPFKIVSETKKGVCIG